MLLKENKNEKMFCNESGFKTKPCTVGRNRKKHLKINNLWTGEAGDFKFVPQIHLAKQVSLSAWSDLIKRSKIIIKKKNTKIQN